MYTLAYINVYTMNSFRQRIKDKREAEKLISKLKLPREREFLLVKIPMEIVRDYRK